MSVREYCWEWELDDAAETPVRVVARVSGRDERWSPQAVSPPECREVEIEARRYFCPSADDRDGCTGCEYEDVTGKASEGWLARMWDMALERDDEHAAEIAAAEREDHRRYMMGEL